MTIHFDARLFENISTLINSYPSEICSTEKENFSFTHYYDLTICSLENVKSLKNEGLKWVAILVSLPIFSITIAFPIFSSADKV
jgi:hypothetical protein